MLKPFKMLTRRFSSDVFGRRDMNSLNGFVLFQITLRNIFFLQLYSNNVIQTKLENRFKKLLCFPFCLERRTGLEISIKTLFVATCITFYLGENNLSAVQYGAIYVYTYMYIFIYTHVYIHTYMYVCMYA